MSSDGSGGAHQVPENQYVEGDGIEQQFFADCFGIFGHGKQTSRIFVLFEYRRRASDLYVACAQSMDALSFGTWPSSHATPVLCVAVLVIVTLFFEVFANRRLKRLG